MSLFGALSASVSGIQAQGTAIGIISDNIANVNTVGYKAGSQSFTTLVTNSGSTVAYSPGGVRAQNNQLIDQQGLIQTTNSPLDVSISGDGFFVVSGGTGGAAVDGVAYTRAGSFRTDSLGNFINASGQFLQAWPIDSEGNLPGQGNNPNTTLSSLLESLETVNIGSASGDASGTTRVEVGINLNASEDIFQGAGDVGTPGSDITNTENAGLRSDEFIVPNANLADGDTMTVSAADALPYTFEYGGFSQSDDIAAADILGAGSLAAAFSAGVANGDAFTITRSGDSSNPLTFTFTTSSSPNTTNGVFNSMATLAEAIDRATGMVARVETVGAEERLYISAVDATEALTFAQVGGSTADFPTELGLANVAATTDLRWNTLDGLAQLVSDNTDGVLGANIIDGNTANAGIEIYNSNPLKAITFSDSTTGDLLAEFGVTSSLVTASYTPGSETSMAAGNIAPHFERGVRVFDSLGEGHDIRIGFLKAANNTWFAEIYVLDDTELSSGDRSIASGAVVFNGDGTLSSIDSSLTTDVVMTWSNEALDSEVDFDFGTDGATGVGLSDGLRQFSGPYNVDFINQNGAAVGLLDSVSIDSDGFITANFNNGETKILYKIPLADFANPNGMIAGSGNTFTQSFESGEVNLKQVGEGGVGTISPSSLEQANTDLSEELTDMIVAQRAYQASAKVITTADELLEELNRVT